jgi:hypothetical protein
VTRTINSIVTKPLICCAVVLATALWADSASAALFHESEDQNLCFNDPYQNTSNGTQLVVTPHCSEGDAASSFSIATYDGFTKVMIGWFSKCMDNRYGAQQDNNPIVLWDCNGGDSQEWDWDGASLHYHVNPAYCASVAWGAPPYSVNGGTLVLYHCNGQGNQKFVMNGPEKSTAYFTACYFRRYLEDSSQCNDSNGNTECLLSVAKRVYLECQS